MSNLLIAKGAAGAAKDKLLEFQQNMGKAITYKIQDNSVMISADVINQLNQTILETKAMKEKMKAEGKYKSYTNRLCEDRKKLRVAEKKNECWEQCKIVKTLAQRAEAQSKLCDDFKEKILPLLPPMVAHLLITTSNAPSSSIAPNQTSIGSITAPAPLPASNFSAVNFKSPVSTVAPNGATTAPALFGSSVNSPAPLPSANLSTANSLVPVSSSSTAIGSFSAPAPYVQAPLPPVNFYPSTPNSTLNDSALPASPASQNSSSVGSPIPSIMTPMSPAMTPLLSTDNRTSCSPVAPASTQTGSIAVPAPLSSSGNPFSQFPFAQFPVYCSAPTSAVAQNGLNPAPALPGSFAHFAAQFAPVSSTNSALSPLGSQNQLPLANPSAKSSDAPTTDLAQNGQTAPAPSAPPTVAHFLIPVLPSVKTIVFHFAPMPAPSSSTPSTSAPIV